jgi:hypothetical protein
MKIKERCLEYLRNNISQTVMLLLNNITVWSSDAGKYITRARGRSPSDITMRIRTTKVILSSNKITDLDTLL